MTDRNDVITLVIAAAIVFATFTFAWYAPHWIRVGEFTTKTGILVERDHEGWVTTFFSEPGFVTWRYYSPQLKEDRDWYDEFRKNPEKLFPELVTKITNGEPHIPKPSVIFRYP